MRVRLVVFILISMSLVSFGVAQVSSPDSRAAGGPSRVSFETPVRDRNSPPAALRPSLESRLSLFLNAQAAGQWDTVSSMLGKYWGAHHSSPDENLVLSAAQKTCVISQLQKFPMLSLAVKGYGFSTEILSMPLSRRWWIVEGEGVIGSDSGEWHQQVRFEAYRDSGEWYFTPPRYNLSWDDLSKADPARDHASEIRVLNDKTSGLQIIGVHAFLKNDSSSPISPALLKVTVKLRNQSRRRIAGYWLALFGQGDGVEFSERLDPGGSAQKELSTDRDINFCTAQQIDLRVTAVRFADGSKWEAPPVCFTCNDPVPR